MDNNEYDHYLDLSIRGVRIGNTGKVKWHIEQDGDIEYDEQYVADVLEKVIQVIRNNNSETIEESNS
jgi:outer membrane protein assembly factor BamB